MKLKILSIAFIFLLASTQFAGACGGALGGPLHDNILGEFIIFLDDVFLVSY